WDFNLETVAPPKPTPEEAKHRRERLHYHTRLQYGMPREKVEEELAKSRVPPARERVDPFASRTESKKQTEEPKPGGPNVPQSESASSAPVETKDDGIRRIEAFYANPEKAASTIRKTASSNSDQAVEKKIACKDP